MLEKPDIPDDLIISHLHKEYALGVAQLAFLPIGADSGTAVYRAAAADGTAFFLKLRKNFREEVVRVPLFLKESGVQEILIPYETKSGQHWVEFGEYTMLLYPFVEGQDGFEGQLTDQQRQIFGAALHGIHAAQVPPELQKLIRRETFSPEWREGIRAFIEQATNTSYADPTAAKLAQFIRSRQNEIGRLIERAEELGQQLRSSPMEFVLCHSDVHGGNILIRTDGQPPILYIVDWDDPILAPKERDLMFIGGGIDRIWKSEQEQAVFYKGYGRKGIDLPALAYYRYERVIEDLVVTCEQLLSTEEGGADREQAYRWFTSNFEPGNTIEIADQTYTLFS